MSKFTFKQETAVESVTEPPRYQSSKKSLIARFWPYEKQYLHIVILDLFCAALTCICDLVLPSDTCPPIVLDDALANYDDERCAAALRLLRREAEHRQILLFTCHSREAEFFRNDPAVRIQRLTDAVPQV